MNSGRKHGTTSPLEELASRRRPSASASPPPSRRSTTSWPACRQPRRLAGTIPGEWTIQEIVDHLVETYRPGVDELRCLLAGERPPGEAVPASLQSKAPHLRPWPWLLGELRRLNADILGLLDAVPPHFETTARAPLVMVVNVPRPGGGFEPLHWVEELDWKAYVIASWRLHPIDHLNQTKQVLEGKARG